MSGDDGMQRVAALKFRAARVAGLDFSRMTRDRAPGGLVGMGGRRGNHSVSVHRPDAGILFNHFGPVSCVLGAMERVMAKDGDSPLGCCLDRARRESRDAAVVGDDVA